MEGITKTFPGVVACDNITLEIQPGEIRALLGENGAGKTTLMNVLSGIYHPQAGSVYLNGNRVNIRSPRDASAHGIGMVHQHFMLVPRHTVVENIIVGLHLKRTTYRTVARMAREKIVELSEQYHLQVDPSACVWQLSVGQQQRVEIVKALYRGARSILILDEPTSALTPQEARELFKTVRELSDHGIAVIFITHKLHEVMDLSHRVTVLRDGQVVDTVSTDAVTQIELARMMVGRDTVFCVKRSPNEPGEVSLDVKGLRVLDDRGHEAVKSIGFKVRSGEILGIAGVDGNGQRELVEALSGLRRAIGGQVLLDGRDITNLPPAELMCVGVQHIPQDRKGLATIGDLSLKENAILGDQCARPFARLGFLRYSVIDAHTDSLLTEFNVNPPNRELKASALSGGNLQKFILARALTRVPKVLVAVQPTSGLDVGAIEFIHRQLLNRRDSGVAILLISMELEEILTLSSRIAVLFEGEIMGEVSPDEARVEDIGLLMAGAREAEKERHTLPAQERESAGCHGVAEEALREK